MSAAPGRDAVDVLGCRIDRLDMGQTLQRCLAAIQSGEQLQHLSINAAKLVALREDPELRDLTRHCGLVNADGQAIVWAARLLGDPLPERVTGIDLMLRIVDVAARDGFRVYLLGARQPVLEAAVRRLRERAPGLIVAGYRNGFFAESELPDVVRDIRLARPEILFVAMSSPLKERFVGTYGPSLGVPLVMGVGGAIDVVAGVTRRAPEAWQRAGFEWLFRLLQEPRRLFRRYAVTNTQFLALLARECLRRRAFPARRD